MGMLDGLLFGIGLIFGCFIGSAILLGLVSIVAAVVDSISKKR